MGSRDGLAGAVNLYPKAEIESLQRMVAILKEGAFKDEFVKGITFNTPDAPRRGPNGGDWHLAFVPFKKGENPSSPSGSIFTSRGEVQVSGDESFRGPIRWEHDPLGKRSGVCPFFGNGPFRCPKALSYSPLR